MSTDQRRSRQRPFPMGVSIGSFSVTAGTAGCMVRKRSDGRLAVLSNWHVLKDHEDILQPGVADGGSIANDKVGVSIGIEIPQSGGNVDCGIAVLDNDSLATSTILEIGAPNGLNLAPTAGMRVKKSGRTTGLTSGEVTDPNAVVSVEYGPGDIRILQDVVITTQMGAGGDSGSCHLDEDNNIVALHFAGSPLVSIACKIGNVINALQIDVITPPPASRCFIATAAFGSELDTHVQFLRAFRDEVVLKSLMKGQFETLLRFYYFLSPPLANKMRQNRAVRDIVKYSIVYPVVGLSKVILLILGGRKKD